MVRTLKNELESNCQMQIPPESKTIAWMIVHATTLLNLDTIRSAGKVLFQRWRGRGHHMGRCVFGERVWYRVGPLTDRRKAEDRMESGIYVGFQMKSSEYTLIAKGEAITARTIRRKPVSERWANPEETTNVPVWPWDRPGHQQEGVQEAVAEGVGRRVCWVSGSGPGRKRIRLNRKTPAHIVGLMVRSRPRVWKRVDNVGVICDSFPDWKRRRRDQDDVGNVPAQIRTGAG